MTHVENHQSDHHQCILNKALEARRHSNDKDKVLLEKQSTEIQKYTT